MKELRTLKKGSNNNEFELRIENKEQKLLQVKTYTKTELKDNYKLIRSQVDQLNHNIAGLKKKVEAKKTTWTEEEEKIKTILAKIMQNQENDKNMTQLDAMEGELKLFNSQLVEIKNVIPEVGRK